MSKIKFIRIKNLSEKKKRKITGLILTLIIIPFFVFPGLPTVNANAPWFKCVKYLFGLILLGVYTYGTYEISQFIFPIKNQKYKNFFTLAIGFGLVFLLWLTGFIWNIHMGPLYFGTYKFLFSGIFIASIILFVINSTGSMNFKDLSISWVMNLFLFIYVISLVILTTQYHFQLILLLTIVVILTDTMGYFGGKKFGKNKAFPEVSPNKTVEGLIIGVASGITFGLITYLILSFVPNSNGIYPGNRPVIIAVIILTAFIAPFGDLIFSKIKRSYDKQDFSNLLPGHGGLFDRIDSHIISISMASLLIITFAPLI